MPKRKRKADAEATAPQNTINGPSNPLRDRVLLQNVVSNYAATLKPGKPITAMEFCIQVLHVHLGLANYVSSHKPVARSQLTPSDFNACVY